MLHTLRLIAIVYSVQHTPPCEIYINRINDYTVKVSIDKLDGKVEEGLP
jgi:hypothetical protein